MKNLLINGLLIFLHIHAFSQVVSGDLMKWHKVTITFDGPQTSEYDTLNPFLDYRLNVTFRNGDNQYVIPGFYAADGNASETSARAGNKWQVRFSPDMIGTWTYSASFKTGKNIAINNNPQRGKPVFFDGQSGEIIITDSDKQGNDLRAHGRLKHNGGHYFQFEESKELYIKGGANSPEDLLGFIDFDQTPAKHKYAPHTNDWNEGDITWKGGKGKNLIGALNYLASTGINAVYFLTMNVMGDGKDVWPWTHEHERYRFDVSKLDQWELVFDHMDKLGLMKHIITQETENECLLDIGKLGIQRKLYYRELIARFSSHLGVFWNMGEENGIVRWSPVGQTEKMRKDMIEYMKALDPYGNPIVIHTLPDLDDHQRTMTPLLGNKALDGVSFQIHHMEDAYKVTKDWREKSAEAGNDWVVWIDEIGPADVGVLSDIRPAQQDSVRRQVIWANLMAGGAGVEHYFGYKHQHTDLTSEDWRVRDRIWKMTSAATGFFQKYLPFSEMAPNNSLISGSENYCFAKEGEIYAVYLKQAEETTVDLGGNTGKYSVMWYNPRIGGALKSGTIKRIKGSGKRSIGAPPYDLNEDWLVLIRKK